MKHVELVNKNHDIALRQRGCGRRKIQDFLCDAFRIQCAQIVHETPWLSHPERYSVQSIMSALKNIFSLFFSALRYISAILTEPEHEARAATPRHS
jgi:hypothetical protein